LRHLFISRNKIQLHFEPGWSWEKCVKPIAKNCQATHTKYIVSERIRVKMNDGSEEEFGPGDVGYVPPGHTAWNRVSL